jgi:tetratricopeptide (TPR) repeat protein
MEKDWLSERLRCLGLDDASSEDFLTEAQDEQTVLRVIGLLTTIPKNPARWLILCECWLLAACDGEIQPEESAFLDLASDFLEISEGEATWLKSTAMAISQENKVELRALVDRGMQNREQTDAVFWQVLFSYLDQQQDLIIFLTDIYLAQGMEYEKMSLNAKALNRYDAALLIDPSCVAAHLLKGSIYARQPCWQAAAEEYDVAAGLSPCNFEVYYQRGLIYQMMVESEKALQDFSRAIALNSELDTLYYHRGQVYSERGEYQLAIEDYEQAIDREPFNDEYYHSLAYAYCHAGKLHQSILKISRAIDISPRNPNWYDSRAEFYMKLGNAESALADCAQALSLDEFFVRAYYFRGVIHDRGGNLVAAADNYRKYLDLAGPEGFEADEILERLKAIQ